MIIALLNEIESGGIVLPAIQRDFVWSEDQIERLLDSVMRGYPIGIALLWDTHDDIQYRRFVQDYRPETPHTFADNGEGRRIKLVLDGQQRLQSLYVALYGTRNGKRLQFDVFSGSDTDDVSEERYHFYFLAESDAAKWRDEALAEAEKPPEEQNSDDLVYPLSVQSLYAMGSREKKELVKELTTKLTLPDDDELRLDLNLARLDEVLTRDPNILKVSVIDENLPPGNPSRKSEADVLEIFVRTNREGTRLSRSDLIFSMLKLNWRESAEALPEFVRSVNQGNDLGIDSDFVVRCLFACSDLGSRLDLDLLRRKSNVAALRQNFERACDAIRATVDFVCGECKIESAALLGGLNTLVPFVYYVFRLAKHDIPNAGTDALRTGVYAASFARPFSRYADSRIGAFIRSDLKPLMDNNASAIFPLQKVLSEIHRWERLTTLDELAQRNEDLTLHLVQGLSGAAVQYSGNSPEVDHIFPRAELRKKGYDEADINRYANFWILAKGKNRNKSNRRPKDYFADVSKTQLDRALIDREMLDYRRYTTFVRSREVAMLKKLRAITGIPESAFP